MTEIMEGIDLDITLGEMLNITDPEELFMYIEYLYDSEQTCF